jgi:hypothetical protein
VSPDYCFAKFSSSDIDYVPKSAFSFNINLKYRIHKRLSIKTGFALKNMGFQTPQYDSILKSNDGGFISFARDTFGTPVTGYKNARIVYSYKFYGIPVLLDYIFNTKSGKTFFNFSCGAELDWLSMAHFEITSNDQTVFDRKFVIGSDATPLPNGDVTIKSFPFVTGIISFGINYKLIKHLLLSLEPSFRYVFMPVPTSGATVNCWSLGVNTGINFSF